ncbi:MAG: hypothetical protein IPP90_14085 [Gemmatimonadaceae bacterium]|nr:hypothetical protein [Gemmatimonadaceae bacterium]
MASHTDRFVHIGTDTKWQEIRSPWISLVGADSNLRPDAFDLAFTEIDAETAETLDNCTFLDATATSVGGSFLRTNGRGMPVVTVGYPLNGTNYVASERRTHPEKVPFTGLSSADDAYARAKVDPRTHLVVDFPHDDVWIGDGVKTPRSLNGVSGGGMFSLPGIVDIGNVAPPRLVAIFIEHSKSLRTVVGVRTDLLFNAIDRSRADGPDRSRR